MQTPFINDMFSIFYKAFLNICPDKKVQIQWVNDIEPIDGEEVSGVTRFADDGAIEIEVLTRQSVVDAVETLIHELAHVIVGPIKEHGDAFHKACDALVEEYTRILDDEFSDCMTLELGTSEKFTVGCENCALRECEGHDGMIVCDRDGESHEPDYVCKDYEKESLSKEEDY